MTLFTETQHTTLLASGVAARHAARAGIAFDPKPVVKLITPHWFNRCLLTEIDPTTRTVLMAHATMATAART